jgi:predicted flap endonuclease-1-like 5' DNA nuclease
MKDKEFENVVIGFLISFAVALGLYWLYRQRREVSPTPLMVARDRRRLPEVAPEPTRAAMAPTKPATPDDLESITGIGPVTARRFNDAGITTFAQLAALTPEKLRQISDTGRWNPADWIKEARNLASQG